MTGIFFPDKDELLAFLDHIDGLYIIIDDETDDIDLKIPFGLTCIVLRGKNIDSEIERLKKIIIGIEDTCETCCNAVWEPLLGCGLKEEDWSFCSGEGNHIYWNDKERRGEET
jgi:hypothetical protein